MNEKLWSIHNAAKWTGVSERTIRNWMRARRISFVKIGRVVRISPEKFKRELATFERQATAE
jgi:excisionase family DNA binding protein